MAYDPSYDFDHSPDEWKTGDEPITERQRDYLSALAAKAGEPMSEEELDSLTKAEASERIDELRQQPGYPSSEVRDSPGGAIPLRGLEPGFSD